MSKTYSKKRRFKYVMLALACTASFSLTGVAAACKKADENNADEDETKTSVVDDQLLKNGNFEVYEVPDDAVHLIKTPTSWSKGGSSYTMSGIIGTSAKAWEALTDEALADKLDANNDLDPSDGDYKDLYVDYNGMKSSDLLYKDSYKALNVKTSADDTDEDGEEVDEHAKDLIENPSTHYAVKSDDNGLYYTDDNGDRQTVYENEDGDYFLDEKFEKPISHVLMLHNYATAHNGTAQNYSSVNVNLPANTSAEISVWVKTAYLKYAQGKEVEQDRGANITVTHTVGNTTLDDFAITDINTEKLIGEDKADAKYDGWVKYTVYINACDFAASTVTLKLGLGETDYNAEGYAFFDDVTVTRFTSLDSENCTYAANESKIGNAKCDLSSDKSEKIFKADSYTRNEGLSSETTDPRYSSNFHYLLDLASTDEYTKVVFGANVKAGLTVDDGYASALEYAGKKIGFGSIESVGDAKLPKDFNALNTAEDVLAYVKAGYSFTESQTKFYGLLNDALGGAVKLPKLDSATDNNMLVMLSAYGAAYTSSFDFTVKGEGQQIISFWVKTSDMNGATAATIKLTQADDEDVNAVITVDSTGVKTDLDDDNEDIYDGWVQCFFFVKNENDEDKTLTAEFSFGSTTVKGTSVSGYKAGWAALANIQTLEVDEDVYAYTGSGDHTASLTLTEDEEKKTHVFDDVYGSQSNLIKENVADPSTYQGVNGGSSAIVNNGAISLPFDDINKNPNAGLINKEYFENYASEGWYQSLLSAFNVDNASSIKALDAWNEIFGSVSVQPLIIVNSLREDYVRVKDANADTYKNYWYKNDKGAFVKVEQTDEYDEDKEYYSTQEVVNYGFVGDNKTISANGYSTVSVRVKVSQGAIAYVYLADTAAGKSILDFNAPRYTFRYDEDGNVLKAEPDKNASLSERRENVLYNLRDDGLYEAKDENGNLKLYANVWNYAKSYVDETLSYFDADGNGVSFDDLKDGETYYATSAGKNGAEANCYLTATDGKKIYEFKDGKYYYMVDGNASSEVLPFDTSFARYDYTGVSEKYFVEINGNDQNVAGKWITVSFVINAGSEAKNYRLELWSGARNEYKTDGNTQNGAVIFDYSYNSVTDDTLMSWYEDEITDAYKNLLVGKGLAEEGFESSTENVKYFADLVEKYIGEGKLTEAEVNTYADGILANYTAHYYTFSLYDSANYHPFNKDVAGENETGYDYDINDYEETLAYLSIKDENSYTVFANYSAIDQSFTTGTDDSDADNGEESGGENNSTTVWLLVSSILLVVALLFTIASIMIRDMIKKKRRSKVTGKNAYDQQKRNRYIRKLHIKKEEFEEVERETDEVGGNAKPAESAEATETETAEEVKDEAPEAVEATEEPETNETVESVEAAPAEAPAKAAETAEVAEENAEEDKAEESGVSTDGNKDGE